MNRYIVIDLLTNRQIAGILAKSEKGAKAMFTRLCGYHRFFTVVEIN